MNTTTGAQRHNARQDKIWDACMNAKRGQIQRALVKMRANIVPDLSVCVIAEKFDELQGALKRIADVTVASMGAEKYANRAWEIANKALFDLR